MVSINDNFGRFTTVAAVAIAAYGILVSGVSISAHAQDAQAAGDSKAVSLAAVAPDDARSATTGGSSTGGPLGGSAAKPWLAVVIQATLVEMGCERVAVSGQWDEATHHAATKALTAASMNTEIAAVPSDDLLRTLRGLRGHSCNVASVGTGTTDDSTRSRLGAPGGAIAKVTPDDKSESKPRTQPKARAEADENAKPSRAARSASSESDKPKARASAPAHSEAPRRAPSQQATGPAVFVRPVGVGSF